MTRQDYQLPLGARQTVCGDLPFSGVAFQWLLSSVPDFPIGKLWFPKGHRLTGGVSASFAMLGDIIIAEKGSMIGFAGKRVIEKTINEQLPEDFQTAEYLLEHGMIDIVVHRKELRETLSKVLSFLKK